MRDHFERMLRPTDRLTLTAWVLTGVWLGVLLIQIGVWLMICLISGDLEFPWWLWTVGGGGLVVGGWWLFVHNDQKARR